MEKVKVLLVESDPFVVEKCKIAFSGSESSTIVGVFSGGKECLLGIDKIDFDVMLLEIALPEIDGLSLLEELKRKNRNFKVIATSAVCTSFVMEKSAQLGASFFLPKPLNYSSLPALVCNVAGDISTVSPQYLVKPQQESKHLDEKIAGIFMTIGIPPHIRGYSYLREAIKLAVAKPAIISSITKELYPNVAEITNSSPSKVERAIRHAIDVAWTRGKSEKLGQILGVKIYVTMKPTNGEFIALIADKLLLESM